MACWLGASVPWLWWCCMLVVAVRPVECWLGMPVPWLWHFCLVLLGGWCVVCQLGTLVPWLCWWLVPWLCWCWALRNPCHPAQHSRRGGQKWRRSWAWLCPKVSDTGRDDPPSQVTSAQWSRMRTLPPQTVRPWLQFRCGTHGHSQQQQCYAMNTHEIRRSPPDLQGTALRAPRRTAAAGPHLLECPAPNTH